MAGVFTARALTILTPLPRQQTGRRFAIAIALAALAVVLRWALDPLLGHVAFYVTVYITVAFCALVCGAVPAIVSGLLGFLGVFFWFVDPRHSLSFIRQTDVHGLVGFFLLCTVLIALGQANRSKQLRLNNTVAALTDEARERKRAQAELRAAHDSLEQRVRERTSELSEALARLESEVKVREHAEQRLRKLSLRLMTLQDEERRRIARELHDTAGQTLAAMKMSITLLQKLEASNAERQLLADDLNALADEALQEVRTASYLLHPPLLDEAGIASAIRWFVKGFAERSGIQIDCDIADNTERPSREYELVLFRVLQESLTNVHRHSGASAATIRLIRNADHLTLEVADNGKGIPQEQLSRLSHADGIAGVGITGMRERVRELGGQLEIRSTDSGTAVSVALPLLEPSACTQVRASVTGSV